ncbi:citrate lyase holo-[acyl-carrier protein] synthase [Acetobacter suratthaniensis]|uniref:citrate lyase holo-[acyl-carrier protein] synthase n=1 Tax=Acetobacter suratthaniensis TaxID=1502841 RepID=A0ABS3LQ98_9PROT|nr:citrate lyase holo-[acyl-carrier protein] synthase [Acetobacter suratthaniensis]MBO1329539.1 citrate lyase holo-[acyl-carrier protein] synthase [Acetobacter suratthaniensis]MCX2567405.1 citrate lyase holo-[acyl-carrier protein] synthase [Acetobacter suratthaniensis]
MMGRVSDSDGAIGSPASFDSILLSRESRVKRQYNLLKRYNLPIISVSTISPGPEKLTEIYKNVFYVALREINARFNRDGPQVVSQSVSYSASGPEAQYVIQSEDAVSVKKATVALEDQHPLGRLWDLDVIAPGMTVVSRDQLDLPPRRCLVCSREALICARNRTHSLDKLTAQIEQIVRAFESEGER